VPDLTAQYRLGGDPPWSAETCTASPSFPTGALDGGDTRAQATAVTPLTCHTAAPSRDPVDVLSAVHATLQHE
jgi:hypothetical protein